ncbi:hypothetical protein [Dyella mobilis]|uniref:ABC-2 type transport system permease protein n=1 Tax=Dyella mobilis TaxID=1849582 RepID=A0ABS2KCQ4_9GAMM|nr:hypothetical protein [Dyella mobilis]MBM7128879.1 hypothetical protein [Dyella mobilis]GLQ99431.1 hypothetical protein GCM10007863_38510 [Dyella mobilis]
MSVTMPLLFKAWRESSGRFLLGAALLAATCVLGVVCRDGLIGWYAPRGEFIGDRYVGYIYRLIYGGPARALFVILSMVLALGGLQRERLHRTVGFTLALPVSRLHLTLAQALLGVGQIAVLSVLPLLTLMMCSRLAHVSYPLGQMARFALLWFVGGTVFFAIAFLSAILFSSEYAALAISFVFSIFYPVATLIPPLSRYPLNIHHIMSGMAMPYFDAREALLVGAPPWMLLACMMAVAAALIAVAVQVARQRDFC